MLSSASADSVCESPDDDNIGVCVFCLTATKRVCQKCADYYCSVECQHRDWPRHRYICFPMPNLVPPKCSEADVHWSGMLGSCTPVNERTERGNHEVLMPEPNSRVWITNFRKSDIVHVRQTSKSLDKKYQEVCEQINEWGKTAPPAKNLYSKQIVLMQYFDRYYRVEVIYRNGDTVLVIFIDSGKFFWTTYNSLFEMPLEGHQLPFFCTQAQLMNVPYFSGNLQITEFLRMCQKHEYIITYLDGEQSVELLYAETGKSLNSEINEVFCDFPTIHRTTALSSD
ncbi:uncharacterized protein LOC115629477 [Scaptodrosophila lebanonensis]|uniref:Uncharacterized protein LOC115629477 n=1 Tax=Drosophila lebanonensis TaxID=7225 RepID=A0A6J2U3V5_DROLE|nr:uncharacterized protein LOC115629477 [Scaptodrosophila lebanonensis]